MTKPTIEASLLDIPDGTVLEVQVHKPHAGIVQIILVAPDGRYKPLAGAMWQLHAQPIIDQNAKGEKLKPVPKDWETDAHLYKPNPLVEAMRQEAIRREGTKEVTSEDQNLK